MGNTVPTNLELFAQQLTAKIGQIRTYKEFDYSDPDYSQEYFNTRVTRDGIRHFVDGIGDINPLYRDVKYCAGSKYRCLIAPPTFLETINYSQHPDNVPSGLEGFLSGFEWEYYRPVCEGDEYTARVVYPLDVQLKTSRSSGHLVIVTEKGQLLRQGAEVVAAYKSWVIFMEGRKSLVQKTPETENEMPHFTKEEIDRVYLAQDNEIPRGREPRYWEDVEIGQVLTPVVRGPYSLSEKFAWFIGKGNPPHCVSDRLFRIIADKHSVNKGVYDSGLNVFIRPSMFDAKTQSDRGITRFHDAGAQRNAWRNMVLTNWMGDDGFLWKSRAELRGLNQEGDISWCHAKVINKYIEQGHYCIDLESWCENHRKQITMPGSATVVLPSRKNGQVTYPDPSHEK
ncbi:MAG TPA: MaoC family dehydratase N-terminal domain-containing protein [Dehalococcoidales bacterium]|nr:MaoC family dehydratase N-terminal domain-containing protein [Dehalococcoidales bacterium]